MRPDSKNNAKAVAKEVLKNPLASSREIAKDTGLSKSTVNNKLAELGRGVTIDRTSSVVAIAERDLEIVLLYQSIALDSMQDIAQKVASGKSLSSGEINQLSSAAEKSQKRQAFIDGENSDRGGGEKQINVIHYGDHSPT